MNETIHLFSVQYTLKPLNVQDRLPLIYSNQYAFYATTIAGANCIFLRFQGDYLSIPRIRKHFSEIPRLLHSSAKCVLWLDTMTAAQKTRLLETQIPFFADEKTAYLPFLGMILDLQPSRQETAFRSRFSAATQCVYIHLLFQKSAECRVKDIQAHVRFSHTSVSAALKELHQKQLLEVTGCNTRKTYWRLPKRAFWTEGRQYLINPVLKRYYADTLTPLDGVKAYHAGESALANRSMLSNPAHACKAVDKADADRVLLYSAMSPNDLLTDNYAIFEVWRYHPGLFADSYLNVDLFSLYAALGDLRNNERIAKEMNGLIERYFDGSGD